MLFITKNNNNKKQQQPNMRIFGVNPFKCRFVAWIFFVAFPENSHVVFGHNH